MRTIHTLTPISLSLAALLGTACTSVTGDPSAGPGAAVTSPPATKRAPVTDTYHGVEVTEDYRWLENWDDPDVKAWTEAQQTYARQHLDALPGQGALRMRFEELLKGDTESYFDLSYAGGRLFAEKYAPPKQQTLLVVTEDPFDPKATRTVVDPNVLDPSGSTSIDWYTPSHDGKLVAISLSKGGTESGDVHVYDVGTGERVHEVIERVNGGTAGGHLAWAPDDSGFYYTRYPRGDERPEEDKNFYQQLWFHQLGTPGDKDRYEIGKDFPRIAEIEVRVHVGTGRAIATVQKGDGGEFAHFLRRRDGTWEQFSDFGDKTVMAVFGARDDIYLLSRAGAPRGKLLRLAITKKLDPSTATVVLPEGTDTLVNNFWGTPSLVVGTKHLYALYQQGGPSTVRAFDHDGKPASGPELLPVSSVSDLTLVGANDLAFVNRSFVDPSAVFVFRPETQKTEKTALETISPASFDGVEVVREMATSKDGTKVPVNILKPVGIELDGSHPLILNGYGGYGVNITPAFRPTISVLLENGILYAIANLRGGGEFGEQWHRQGNLTNKQNVFDDFVGVAEHLVARGYTSKERLGLRGRSNGGLLMGAVVTQHPDLARVVVSQVGVYDMLRVELSPNGAFNVTEYGTVKNPDHFKAMVGYSPYHNVRDGVAYPAMLLPTGVNDPRVDPMNSRKMVARLQAANDGGGPILLRTSYDTGHGGGTPLDEQINELVDEFSFYFHFLEVTPRSGVSG